MSSHQIVSAENKMETLLAGLLQEPLPAALAAKEIAGVTLDSRCASSGMLFAAVPGTVVDGRQFAASAIASGAEAVVFDSDDAPASCQALEKQGEAVALDNLAANVSLIAARLYDHPSRKLQTIGVTGTNGKTTCATLIQQCLDALGTPCAVMGTLGVGLKETLQDTGLTTADAVSVQQFLGGFVDQGAQAVCMEVSSHGLDQGRVNAVDFNVAVFTNLSRDHLDYHGTMAAYGAAKKQLFSFDCLDTIVVNNDDVFGREILSAEHPCQTISYGLSDADIQPVDYVLDQQGIAFTLEHDGKRARFNAPLLGEFNLQNLLATVATLVALRFSLEQIADVFPGLVPPPGRMERFHGKGSRPTVVVDYAHTPAALSQAIEGLRVLCAGRLYVVVGCGGDRDRTKRSMMGRIAVQNADQVVITNDNPRSERPQAIANEMLADVDPAAVNVVTILDRRAAIAHAIALADNADIVLVAGKGHETGQEINGQKLPFSDREVVSSILEVAA